MSRRLRQLRAKVVRAQRAHRTVGPAMAELQRAVHAQLRSEIAAARSRHRAAETGQMALDLDLPEPTR